MKQIIEKVFTNSVILSGAKNLKPVPSLATSHKRYSIVCSAESRGEGKGFTLAEVFSPCRKVKLSFGFTLAEVLITLGIIGVVAALTLPTLIQNYQKQVWVNQLKKAVSVWENGMKMMLADADTDDLRNTEFWQSIHILDAAHGGGSYGCFVGSSNDDYIVADNILKKYFKILKFADPQDEGNCSLGDNIDGTKRYRGLNGEIDDGYYGEEERKIYMADGTLYGLYLYAGTDRWIYPILVIDVNGENKGPNQWGRDSFAFHILPNGNLVPNATYEYMKKYLSLCGNLETGDISEASGYGCSARIIADGWKMNY